MARYRVIGDHPAYMPTRAEVGPLDLGDAATNRAFAIRAPVYEVVPPGTEVDFPGIPGPHLEPLDEAAREAMRAYMRSSPGSVSPTDTLPMQGGFDSVVQGQLNRLLAEAEERPALAALAPAAAATDAKLDAMAEAITKLAAIVGALAPAATGRRATP